MHGAHTMHPINLIVVDLGLNVDTLTSLSQKARARRSGQGSAPVRKTRGWLGVGFDPCLWFRWVGSGSIPYTRRRSSWVTGLGHGYSNIRKSMYISSIFFLSVAKKFKIGLIWN